MQFQSRRSAIRLFSGAAVLLVGGLLACDGGPTALADRLRVSVDKTLYAPNEAMQVTVRNVSNDAVAAPDDGCGGNRIVLQQYVNLMYWKDVPEAAGPPSVYATQDPALSCRLMLRLIPAGESATVSFVIPASVEAGRYRVALYDKTVTSPMFEINRSPMTLLDHQ